MELRALIVKAQVPENEKLIAYLEKEGVYDVEDFAVLCDEEADVSEQIVKKAGLDPDIVKVKISVKKVWCRTVPCSDEFDMPGGTMGPGIIGSFTPAMFGAD